MLRAAKLAAFLGPLALAWLGHGESRRAAVAAFGADGSKGCLECHAGIEPMHPEAELSCVGCHGGDASARTKREAHVPRGASDAGDERVAPRDEDLSWRRFRNPMDLRVAETVCGDCHGELVQHLQASLHGTTAGHLSDGYYEVGLLDRKGSTYSIFPVPGYFAEPGDVGELTPIPSWRAHPASRGPRDALATHYPDLARKECMQCHLWSTGRATRGRVGFDGDYRGEGCAACHVDYALDGFSESADRSANRTEPGHPRAHVMTAAPDTQTCATCHYGDASIGLHFRGLSQLPPGAPGGPETPGTTDRLLNRAFYMNDAEVCPPDVHYERGMHCIDCHTVGDVMGDGRLYGSMEHAVEIACEDCHGDFGEPATLVTRKGNRLDHMFRRDGEVILTSKVTGEEHVVPQAAHVLDPGRAAYNPEAARAMNDAHAKLECYTCHAGWNVNFPGFHFDRNESLTQLDLLSGKRTPGRVTTQEKTFATWKSFYAGLNEAGRVAPYLTGFSTMGTVRDEEGRVIVDQELPVTAAGLSGLTMIHHQLHSTRPTARDCVECHRSSATWGLGSVNFRLGRQLAFVADRRGIEALALDRTQLAASTPLAKFVLPDVVALELECDPLQGRARRLFASEGYRGVHALDVSDPTAMRRAAFAATVNPRDMALAGEHLYLADGVGGLRVFDVSGGGLEPIGALAMFDAHGLALQWPYLYVADGPGGLVVVDVRDPGAPTVVGGTRLAHSPGVEDLAVEVAVLFQYSRPLARGGEPDGEPLDHRSDARMLAAVLDEREGLVLVDVTEPAYARVLYPPRPREGRSGERSRARDGQAFTGLALLSHVDLAEPQGGTRTTERDYVYLQREGSLRNGEKRSSLEVWDVSSPARARRVERVMSGYATEMLVPLSIYNPPFLQTVLLSPGEQGVLATDATVSAAPRQLGAFAALDEAYVVAVEEFPIDRMLDESNRPLKDVSHAGSRWLTLPEIERLMLVPAAVLETAFAGDAPSQVPGATARLELARLDADGSGLLEGVELAAEGGGSGLARTDADGDGRVTLSELEGLASLVERGTEASPAELASAFLRTRTDRDGDLTRLLDGVNPFAHDKDGDRRLDRRELEAAFVTALDLDGDGELSLDELSRHPGPLRQLRYRDGRARELFAALDRNRNGRVSRREYRLRDEDLGALDADRDGLVHLGEPPNPWWERRGFPVAESEWPSRQEFRFPLPPVLTREELEAIHDRDGDGVLTQRELKGREDLLLELDLNGDGRLVRDELDRAVRLVGAYGVDATLDGWLERWDRDGDGRVEEGEVAEVALRAARRAE